MKLQFLGHACFLLDDGVHKVLTDPFLTGAGRPEWAEKVDPDVIFVTHGHGDHVGMQPPSPDVPVRRSAAQRIWRMRCLSLRGWHASPEIWAARSACPLAAPSFSRPSTAAVRRAVLPAASFLRWGAGRSITPETRP